MIYLIGGGLLQCAASAACVVASSKEQGNKNNPYAVFLGTVATSQLLINSGYVLANTAAKTAAAAVSLFFCAVTGQMLGENSSSSAASTLVLGVVVTYLSLAITAQVTLVAGPIFGLLAGQAASTCLAYFIGDFS